MSSAHTSPESRAAHVISQIYYYVAAVGGFGLFLGGTIALLFGVRELVLPRDFETTRDGVGALLHGVAFVLPGVAIMWWHLRQARRREERPPTTVFWGRVLYFHLVSLVSLLFVVIGTVGTLVNLAEASTAECESSVAAEVRTIPHEAELEEVPVAGGPVLEEYCYPTRDDALRNAVDASLILIVAGPVFWWHLRQGRRLTVPAPDAEI
ncbi:MAG: DUF5671 domain-containing protein [Actinomycetota bacterium]